jgi:hypothetical protein
MRFLFLINHKNKDFIIKNLEIEKMSFLGENNITINELVLYSIK